MTPSNRELPSTKLEWKYWTISIEGRKTKLSSLLIVRKLVKSLNLEQTDILKSLVIALCFQINPAEFCWWAHLWVQWNTFEFYNSVYRIIWTYWYLIFTFTTYSDCIGFCRVTLLLLFIYCCCYFCIYNVLLDSTWYFCNHAHCVSEGTPALCVCVVCGVLIRWIWAMYRLCILVCDV